MKLQPALIELVVKDMPATLAFYRLLGIDLPPEADSQPHVDAELSAASGWPGTPRKRSGRSTPTGSRRPPAGTGWRSRSPVPSPAEVDSAYAEITGAGYHGHLAPWDAFWGMRYAVVHDPNGVPIDLCAQLPAG